MEVPMQLRRTIPHQGWVVLLRYFWSLTIAQVRLML